MTKEKFSFSYTKPFSDWFETVNVEIKPDDYYYFKLELRFGKSWWVIGSNPIEKPKYHWEETQIGEINNYDLKRFLEWAKDEKGSRVTQIKSISGEFNVIEEILKITA